MNKITDRLIRQAAAEADHIAAVARREAPNVGEPHHSHILARAAEAQDAADELRALVGLAPGTELWSWRPALG